MSDRVLSIIAIMAIILGCGLDLSRDFNRDRSIDAGREWNRERNARIKYDTFSLISEAEGRNYCYRPQMIGTACPRPVGVGPGYCAMP